MKILVTGSSGMVGKNLQEYISKYTFEHTFYFVTRNHANLENTHETRLLFQKYSPHVVVHLAASVGGVYFNHQYNHQQYTLNSQINKNIIQMCKEFNIQYGIFILSTCIYPHELTESSELEPLKEEQLFNGKPHHSNYGYAIAKRELYEMCQQFNTNTTENQFICLAPTNLYGKYDHTSERSHVIPSLLNKLKNNQFVVRGHLDSKRQYLYVDDLIRVILEILNRFGKQPLQHPLYNITPPHVTTLKQLSDLIFGDNQYTLQPDNLGQMTRIASHTLFKQEFPEIFHSLTPLKNGLHLINS